MLLSLQQCAIAISVVSIIWNGVEGGLSIGFGAETSSRSLVFFGIQSAIEVISAIIVVWRFLHVAKPGEEHDASISATEIKFEKYSTIAIGGLLIALSIATIASASTSLAFRLHPDASTPALVISASALLIMLFIWLPKRYLAKALNSSAMQGEAACSLACIQITLVLFVGALAYRLRRAAWWLDSTTALVLALMFAAEGIKMLRWGCNPAFDGGCCDHCGRGTTQTKGDLEMPPQYRDICTCCSEKEICKTSDRCRCSEDMDGCETQTKGCCELRDDGKCCTRELRTGVSPITHPATNERTCSDECCVAAKDTTTTNANGCGPCPASEPMTCARGCCTSLPAPDTTCCNAQTPSVDNSCSLPQPRSTALERTDARQADCEKHCCD